MTSRAAAPLWRCPRCRRQFANRNQPHACGRYSLPAHFAGKPKEIAALYRAFLRAVRDVGVVKVLPEKTRIAFQVRMSFAQLTPRRRWIDGHLVLARAVDASCIRKVETFSRRNHVHHFRLERAADITPELKALIKEAYAVGEQRHLDRGPTGSDRPLRAR
jgi:hypothetical protein